jgi:hypothetical protein
VFSNAFELQTDGAIQRIPIQGIGEDFHSQLDDGRRKQLCTDFVGKDLIEWMIRTKKIPQDRRVPSDSPGLDSLDKSLRDVFNDVSKNIRTISNSLNRVFP